MRGNYIPVLILVFLWFPLPVSRAFPVGIQTIQESLNLTPVVLKGEVLEIDDLKQKESIFDNENALEQFGGKNKEAQIRVESIIKGSSGSSTITVVFHDAMGPFTRLEKGRTYILFLSESQHGLRLLDPCNGGIRVESGGGAGKETMPIKKMMRELEYSLNSKDEVILCTAILGLAEIGSPETRPRIRPFLEHKSEKVRTSAISACLRLGDWHLVTNAVNICISPPLDRPQLAGCLGLQSLDTFRSLTEGLGSVTNMEAVPVLVRAINQTSDKLVRQKLIESLTNMQDERSVPLLLKLLRDGDSDVSFLAYRALAKMANISYAGSHIFEGERKRNEIEKLERWSKERASRKFE